MKHKNKKRIYKNEKKKINHDFLAEFIKRAPYDGIILYPSNNYDEIIKIKPFDLLTVDLIYDEHFIFLDSDKNCYNFF